MLSKDPRSREATTAGLKKIEGRPLLARTFSHARPPRASAALRLQCEPVQHGRGRGTVSPGPKNTKGWGQSTQKTQGKRHHFQTQKRGPSRPRPPTPITPIKRPSPGAHFWMSTRRPAAAPSPTNPAAKWAASVANATLACRFVAPLPAALRLDFPSDDVSKAIGMQKSVRGTRRERRDCRPSTANIAPPPPHQPPQTAAPPPLLPIGGSVPTTPTPDPTIQMPGGTAPPRSPRHPSVQK